MKGEGGFQGTGALCCWQTTERCIGSNLYQWHPTGTIALITLLCQVSHHQYGWLYNEKGWEMFGWLSGDLLSWTYFHVLPLFSERKWCNRDETERESITIITPPCVTGANGSGNSAVMSLWIRTGKQRLTFPHDHLLSCCHLDVLAKASAILHPSLSPFYLTIITVYNLWRQWVKKTSHFLTDTYQKMLMNATDLNGIV